MTRFWLIRHGQTDWNAQGRWQGQAPYAPPLNAAGQAQTEALAERLNGRLFEAIYSSDLLRARQTADILAARIGLSARIDPRLREINQGAWEGMLGDDIASQYPEEMAWRERDPLNAHAPGGESLLQVAARVWAAAGDIARAHPTGTVLVVSHGLSLAAVICQARNQPLTQAYAFIPPNTQPEIVEWTPAG